MGEDRIINISVSCSANRTTTNKSTKLLHERCGGDGFEGASNWKLARNCQETRKMGKSRIGGFGGQDPFRVAEQTE